MNVQQRLRDKNPLVDDLKMVSPLLRFVISNELTIFKIETEQTVEKIQWPIEFFFISCSWSINTQTDTATRKEKRC